MNLSVQYLEKHSIHYYSWHTESGIKWTGKKSYWLEGGAEVVSGRAEGSSATEDRGQAVISLTPDVDAIGSGSLQEPDACSHLWKSATSRLLYSVKYSPLKEVEATFHIEAQNTRFLLPQASYREWTSTSFIRCICPDLCLGSQWHREAGREEKQLWQQQEGLVSRDSSDTEPVPDGASLHFQSCGSRAPCAGHGLWLGL